MPVPTRGDARPSALSDGVYDWLLARIIDGTYPPGLHLDDERLAREAGTSVGPLREALGRLAAARVVEIVPRHYTVVSPISRSDLRDAAAVVYALTGQAMYETTGRLTADDCARLVAYRDDVLSDRERARESVRTAEVWSGLYGVFIDRHANPEFVRVLRWVGPYVRRFNHAYADRMDLDEEIRFELAEIGAALDGDRAALATIWRQHVSTPLAALIASVGEYGVPASTEHLTLADVATRTIRDALLEGTLLPGDTLRESELMEWLGMSRTPVRTALARMVELGLVDQRARRTAHVAPLDPRSLRAVGDALWVLRSVAVRAEVERGSHELADEMARRLAVAVRTHGDLARRLAAMRVTCAIDETVSTESPLGEALAALSLRARWLVSNNVTPDRPIDTADAHPVIEAVARGDADGAVVALAACLGVDEHAVPPAAMTPAV